MYKEITIIGGAGHVGLAFGLVCASKNIKVHLYDINSNSLNKIKKGKMPHKEDGAQKILNKALDKNLLSFSDNIKDLKLNNINVICIGTPVDEFLNPQYKILLSLIKDLLKIIRNNQHFIIRSTVYPGTTDFLYTYLKNKNKKIKLSFCPERFMQGSAMVEFKKIPQIIGSVNPTSRIECETFMKKISKILIAIVLLTTSIVSIAGSDEVNLTVKGFHNNNIRILDNNSVLFSGDSFQLSVEALAELYIYVFLIDSNNNIQQLKPPNSKASCLSLSNLLL